MTSAEGQQAIQSLSQQASSEYLAPLVLERLIDGKIQAGPRGGRRASPSPPEQIDAKIVEESTTPEERHAWIIAVDPEVDEGKDEPTDAQKAAAKKKADQALADVTTGGKKWEDVAKAVSTDASARDRRRPRLDHRGSGRGSEVARSRLRRRAERADRRHRG